MTRHTFDATLQPESLCRVIFLVVDVWLSGGQPEMRWAILAPEQRSKRLKK